MHYSEDTCCLLDGCRSFGMGPDTWRYLVNRKGRQFKRRMTRNFQLQ